MIDLHCHILPGIDDGAKTVEISLEMARIAASDGITTTACTPHILPGVYNNTGPAIREAIAKLQGILDEAGISIQLVTGADVHVAPDLVTRLREGQALTLNNSRYLLVEPPHHVLPPKLETHFFSLLTAGYVPILTHPERLSWIDGHYDLVKRLVHNGNLIQITAGSLLGRFGRRPRYWAERMLDEGLCHILATDAHNCDTRLPRLSDACELIIGRLGDEETTNLVLRRPRAILENANPSEIPPVLGAGPRALARTTWTRFFKRGARQAK